jgi:uncharacterized protein YecE (DUF72 family)
MIKEITRKEFNSTFDWEQTHWIDNVFKEDLKNNLVTKHKAWSRVEIDNNFYLIPGIHDNANLIYSTKKIIDYNVIVKL